MFSFAVNDVHTGRPGTVVSGSSVIEGRQCVVVMWDDDFSFSSVDVEDLAGNPVNLPVEKASLTVLPGGKGDDPEPAA